MSSFNKPTWGCFYFALQLTSTVHDCQHDGGDPGHLAACHIEDHLDFFEEDSDGLWKRIGEANRDEGPDHYHPSPATLGRCVALRTTNGRRHFPSVTGICAAEKAANKSLAFVQTLKNKNGS